MDAAPSVPHHITNLNPVVGEQSPVQSAEQCKVLTDEIAAIFGTINAFYAQWGRDTQTAFVRLRDAVEQSTLKRNHLKEKRKAVELGVMNGANVNYKPDETRIPNNFWKWLLQNPTFVGNRYTDLDRVGFESVYNQLKELKTHYLKALSAIHHKKAESREANQSGALHEEEERTLRKLRAVRLHFHHACLLRLCDVIAQKKDILSHSREPDIRGILEYELKILNDAYQKTFSTYEQVSREYFTQGATDPVIREIANELFFSVRETIPSIRAYLSFSPSSIQVITRRKEFADKGQTLHTRVDRIMASLLAEKNSVDRKLSTWFDEFDAWATVNPKKAFDLAPDILATLLMFAKQHEETAKVLTERMKKLIAKLAFSCSAVAHACEQNDEETNKYQNFADLSRMVSLVSQLANRPDQRGFFSDEAHTFFITDRVRDPSRSDFAKYNIAHQQINETVEKTNAVTHSVLEAAQKAEFLKYLKTDLDIKLIRRAAPHKQTELPDLSLWENFKSYWQAIREAKSIYERIVAVLPIILIVGLVGIHFLFPAFEAWLRELTILGYKVFDIGKNSFLATYILGVLKGLLKGKVNILGPLSSLFENKRRREIIERWRTEKRDRINRERMNASSHMQATADATAFLNQLMSFGVIQPPLAYNLLPEDMGTLRGYCSNVLTKLNTTFDAKIAGKKDPMDIINVMIHEGLLSFHHIKSLILQEPVRGERLNQIELTMLRNQIMYLVFHEFIQTKLKPTLTQAVATRYTDLFKEYTTLPEGQKDFVQSYKNKNGIAPAEDPEAGHPKIFLQRQIIDDKPNLRAVATLKCVESILGEFKRNADIYLPAPAR